MKFNADLMNDFLCNDDKLFINIRRGREAQQAVCQTDMDGMDECRLRTK